MKKLKEMRAKVAECETKAEDELKKMWTCRVSSPKFLSYKEDAVMNYSWAGALRWVLGEKAER